MIKKVLEFESKCEMAEMFDCIDGIHVSILRPI